MFAVPFLLLVCVQAVQVSRQLTLVSTEWYDCTGTISDFKAIQTPPGHLSDEACYELVLKEGANADNYVFTRLHNARPFIPVAYFGFATGSASSINFTLEGRVMG